MFSFQWQPRRRRLRFLPSPAAGGGDPQGPRQSRRAYRAGLLIVGSLTSWLLGWLIYRWLFQPAWLVILPALLSELVRLVETAGAFTLALVWIGLGYSHWRQMRRARAGTPTSPALSLEKLYTLAPGAFERYVAALFRQKGYHVVVRGRSGDHGVDLEVTNARGRRAIVQCKRYHNTVGEEIVRDLYGTLLHERAAHAFVVTTADISDAARQWARGKPITLIDGQTLVRIAAALRRRIDA